MWGAARDWGKLLFPCDRRQLTSAEVCGSRRALWYRGRASGLPFLSMIEQDAREGAMVGHIGRRVGEVGVRFKVVGRAKDQNSGGDGVLKPARRLPLLGSKLQPPGLPPFPIESSQCPNDCRTQRRLREECVCALTSRLLACLPMTPPTSVITTSRRTTPLLWMHPRSDQTGSM